MAGILKAIQNNVPDLHSTISIGVGRMHETIELYSLNIDPEYQRGHVWTTDQEEKFVGALLENSSQIPPLWINSKDDLTNEVIDGKQRITAILRWINGDVKAVCPCGHEVMYSDLVLEEDKRNLNLEVRLILNFVKLCEVQVMEFYLRLNSGGTVHDQSELSRVKQLIRDRINA